MGGGGELWVMPHGDALMGIGGGGGGGGGGWFRLLDERAPWVLIVSPSVEMLSNRQLCTETKTVETAASFSFPHTFFILWSASALHDCNISLYMLWLLLQLTSSRGPWPQPPEGKTSSAVLGGQKVTFPDFSKRHFISV